MLEGVVGKAGDERGTERAGVLCKYLYVLSFYSYNSFAAPHGALSYMLIAN